MGLRGCPFTFGTPSGILLFLFGEEADDIDKADTVEPDGYAAHHTGGVVPVVDGLESGVVYYLEVFGFEEEPVGQTVHLVERAEGVQNPVADALDILVFRHLDSLHQGGVDVGGDSACLGAEAHIAAAERQPVVGAYNGAGHQLDGVLNLLQQVADDGNLLKVFLAEVGASGLRQVEETAHHNGYP